MKIVHIITRLILGGAQENTVLTCEGQHAAGHEVTLITGPALGPEGELLSRAQASGYRVEILPDMRRELHPRDWRVYHQLRRLLRDLNPDIVHTHSSKAGILGRAAAAKLDHAKVVHTIHGLPYHPYNSRFNNWLYITAERHAAKQSDAILCVADAMTRQALAAGVGQPEQYTTVYSGMEIEPFLTRPAAADAFRASLGLPDDAILVTQVSRLAELKGHEDIIAADLLEDPRVHICFVGDGWLRADIEQQIAHAGQTDRYHLTGLLPRERIPEVMHATDILVHCSYREGLARTLPQAMLAGRPVVSYDVDGAREVVDDTTGRLLAPGDTAGLRAAVAELVADADLRTRLGQAGQGRCRVRFDWRTMVAEIQKVYDRL